MSPELARLIIGHVFLHGAMAACFPNIVTLVIAALCAGSKLAFDMRKMEE